jgi:sulfur-carrier protein adenylyltransferase/sulfurtransferase
MIFEMLSVEDPVRTIPEVSAVDLFAQLANGSAPFLLDVREPHEAAEDLGFVEGSYLIPLRSLSERVEELADLRHERIVVICAVGGRSAVATRYLIEQGFERVANLAGGLLAWHDDGLPFRQAARGDEAALLTRRA